MDMNQVLAALTTPTLQAVQTDLTTAVEADDTLQPALDAVNAALASRASAE